MANKRKKVSRQSTKRISISLNGVEPSLEVQTRRGVATTPAQRRAIQASPLSYRKLAELFHVNVKTIEKWKHSRSVQDLTRGPRGGKSKSLTEKEEQEIVYYYVTAGKSVDSCLKDMSKKFPLLTRSTYYRCIKRVRDYYGHDFDFLRLRAKVSKFMKPMNLSSNDDV